MDNLAPDHDPDGVDAEPVSDEGPAAEPGRSPAVGQTLLALAAVAWAGWAFIRWVPAAGPGVPPVALATAEEDEAPALAEPETGPERAVGELAPPAPAPDVVEEQAAEPIAIDPEWAKELGAPQTVMYTVRHGGTLENVANLYKLYHHQILALNPGIDLKKELPSGSKVVVFRHKEGRESASVGFPGRGRLEGAVPMPEGPGRILKMIPWKSWGTPQTVAVMDGVLKEWARQYPDADPVLVGNMSAPEGGKLRPHSSHQSGRDVDLGYMQKPGLEKEYNWREISARNLDASKTWDLLRLLAKTGAVEIIYIDQDIQRALYDHALKQENMSKATLRRWLEYPTSGGTRALVQHVKGHVDHLHVRIACPPGDGRCKTRAHGS